MDDQINQILNRGIVNIIPRKDELQKLLKSDKKLNVYFGIDPTATKIHLGHAVPLRKLNALAQLGHNVYFLIGDFTALIGDTSDKESERPVLTYEEIKSNFETYKTQAEKIIDFSQVKVVYNSEWLKSLKFEDIIKLCQHFSVGDFVGRELVKKRLEGGKKVGLHETLYPVMQGYDSYHLDTDIQLGAADQTFNMQAGRTLLKDLAHKESFVLVTDYLPGTDGRKMSKTWGNAIWLDDDPKDMFGKIMSLNDDVINTYANLATSLSDAEVKQIEESLKSNQNPMETKLKLAEQIVTELHSNAQAVEARDHFKKTFQDSEPDFSEHLEINANDGISVVDVVSKILESKSEAKRLISQNAIQINGETVKDYSKEVKQSDKIKVGKKRFVTVDIK